MSIAPFTSDDKPDYFTMSVLNYIDTATQDAIIWEHITFEVNLIKDASGNEFVKVVRCRDCKHYHEAGIASYTPFCEWMNDSDVTPDGFCAWAERRWLTCKCGHEMESEGSCPMCGRYVREDGDAR